MKTTAHSDQTNAEAVLPPAESKTTRDGLGPYRLDSMVAENATGTVFSATHRQLKHRSTLIVLPTFAEHDPKCVAEFTREMGTIGSVDHPNVVKVLDAGEDHGLHYIAMEYVDGIDLQTILQNRRKVSPAAACEIVRQAAIGLLHIHGKDLLHRGMKPSNLMISKKGIVKIIGLGVAALQGSDLKAQAKDSLPSSANYLAPEQFLGKPEPRSDIYGLGCVLYRLLSGQLPPNAAVEEDGENLSLSKTVPDLSPELVAVVKRMTAIAPENRFQNFNQVVAAMCNWASNEGISELLSPSPKSSSSPNASPAKSSSGPSTEPSEQEQETQGQQAVPKDTSPSDAAWALIAMAGLMVLAGLSYWVFWSKKPDLASLTAPATSTSKVVSHVAISQGDADEYHGVVRQQLQQEHGLKGGKWVLPPDEVALANMAVTYGHTASLAPSDGQIFSHAIRMEVEAEGENPWDSGLYMPDVSGIRAGDCVVMIVWLRTTPNSASPLGKVSVFAEDATTDTKEVYATVTPTEQWRRYVFPFQAKSDAVLRIGFHLAYQTQELDYAGYTVINFGNEIPHWEATAAKMSASNL